MAIKQRKVFLCVVIASASFSAACSRSDNKRPIQSAGLTSGDLLSETNCIDPDDVLNACDRSGEYWQRQLGAEGHVIVRPPFVLAGNLETIELQSWYEQTIKPAAGAMNEQFFERRPERPMVVLLFRDEATYRAMAERLFGDRDVSRHGYHRPHLHTIIVNAGSGPSALLHELTHALMAFDFREAPAWLREGLASLFEDCQIGSEPPGIVPLAGARTATLQRAIREDRLPSLESLILAPDFEGPQSSVYYAMARHFCLFLDHHGALAPVYRTLRSRGGAAGEDIEVIRRNFGDRSWNQLQDEFRLWAMAL